MSVCKALTPRLCPKPTAGLGNGRALAFMCMRVLGSQLNQQCQSTCNGAGQTKPQRVTRSSLAARHGASVALSRPCRHWKPAAALGRTSSKFKHILGQLAVDKSDKLPSIVSKGRYNFTVALCLTGSASKPGSKSKPHQVRHIRRRWCRESGCC
jgi:hypothetical protein